MLYPSNKFGCRNVLFIDETLENYQILYDSANDKTLQIAYKSDDTTESILQLFRIHFTVIDRIALAFTKDRPFINNADFHQNADVIIQLIREFSVKNIDFLACETLGEPDWVNYYNTLYNETGVIVGASNDRTGNIKYGGNWVMESTGQNVEQLYWTSAIRQYSSLLDSDFSFIGIIMSDYSVYTCGANNNGKQGLGYATPTAIISLTASNSLPSGINPKYFISGSSNSMIITNDGRLYICGSNFYGQIGNNITDRGNVLTWFNIPSSSYSNKKAIYATFGTNSTYVLMSDSTIYACGHNKFGQLGIGTSDIESYPNPDVGTIYPTLSNQVINNTGYTPKYISAGGFCLLVLMTNGKLYGVGYNQSSMITSNLLTTNNTPGSCYTILTEITDVPVGETIKYISTSSTTAYLVMESGKIYTRGQNLSGKCGIGNVNVGSEVTSYTLMKIRDNTNTVVDMGSATVSHLIPKYVSAANSSFSVLMTNGDIYVVGNNGGGMIGNGNAQGDSGSNLLYLTKGTNNTGKIPKYITLFSNALYVMMSDNTLYGVGSNGAAGILGMGTTATRYPALTPTATMPIGKTPVYMSNMMLWTDENPTPITNADVIIFAPEPSGGGGGGGGIISDSCFPGNTPISTDQGIIPIDKLCPDFHTIHRKRILAVTKTTTVDKYLVCFEKNALSYNYPSERTVMTGLHKVLYNGQLIPAKNFVSHFNVKKIKYYGQPLYNILLDTYSIVKVNNLICETLHPENPVAKYFMETQSTQSTQTQQAPQQEHISVK